MKTNYIILMCYLIIGTLLTVSCKEEEDLGTPRLFKPRVTEVDNSVDNQLTIKWIAMEGAVGYKIDLGSDSLFQFIYNSYTLDSTASSLVIDNLRAATQYFIRIQAINADTLYNSKFKIIPATTSSIYLNNPNFILDNSFIAKWQVRGLPVTKIKVKLNSKEEGYPLVKEFEVAEIEASHGLKTVSGFKGETEYLVELYSGELLRGIGVLTTKPSILNAIDLRDLDPLKRDSLFNDAIINSPDGAVLLLKRGQTYNLTTTHALSKNLTLMSGYDFISDLAEIRFSGGKFVFADACNIGTIAFNDLILRGANNGGYLFQSNSVNSTIDNVIFEGCRISTFRGVFRIQNSEIVNNLKFNNCVIDSTRDYGVTRIYQTYTNIVKNITVTNSTLYNLQRGFVNTKFLPNTPTTLNIENCTFYNSPIAGNYLIDYGSDATLLASVTIKNCIFGMAGTAPVAPAVAGLGFRVAPSESFIADGSNYVTSDFYISGIPEATIYNGTSTSLFKDPQNRDFTIIDASFPGRKTAGDPRWRP
jgi:hypothetical protein